jgi:hypothetical protein
MSTYTVSSERDSRMLERTFRNTCDHCNTVRGNFKIVMTRLLTSLRSGYSVLKIAMKVRLVEARIGKDDTSPSKLDSPVKQRWSATVVRLCYTLHRNFSYTDSAQYLQP